MGYEVYTGIVAREVDTGEADRFLTIISAEHGKFECFARGIRRQKSKLAPQAGLMAYGEFQLFRKGERYILTSAKASETFYKIRMDIIKCAYAVHFLEIASDVVVEAQAFPEALQLLLNSLHVLCYRDLAPEFISRVFEIRMLSLAGFAPLLDRCSVCGSQAQPDKGGSIGFAVYGDGLVCGGCRQVISGRVAQITRGSVLAMRYVIESGAGKIFDFYINESVSGELSRIVPEYLTVHFGREYTKAGEAERYREFEREMSK